MKRLINELSVSEVVKVKAALRRRLLRQLAVERLQRAKLSELIDGSLDRAESLGKQFDAQLDQARRLVGGMR